MTMFNLNGWKDIYSFTFIQTLKNKSFKVSFAILCILAAVVLPCAAFISDSSYGAEEENGNGGAGVSGETKSITEVEAVYLYFDNSDKALESVITDWEGMYKCEYLHSDKEVLDSKRADINNDNTYALLSVNSEDGLYDIDITVGWEIMHDMGVLDEALESLKSKLELLQLDNVSTGLGGGRDVEVSGFLGESGENYSDKFNFLTYMIQLGYIMILIFIISFSAERIATSVVTEKAGKMVEFLMITVRPMAVMAGKVLAVISTVIIQVLAMILSAAASAVMCNIFFDNIVTNYIVNSVENLNGSSMSFTVNPLSVLIAILFVLGGLLFYSLVASLAGASVSKIEEVSEGMVIVTFMLMIGAYMAIGVGMRLVMNNYSGEQGIYETVTYLLPLSSPFSVPQNILTGSVDIGSALLSLLILYAAVVFLIVLSSKVYEFMLFYNGTRLKIKDIVNIAAHGRVKGDN